MGNLKHAIITFGKAQCSAWIASAVDFGVSILLAEVFHLWYGYATTIGAFSGGIVNCIINYNWVFRSHSLGKYKVALRYLAVWMASILLNSCGTCFFTELTGLNFVIVKAAVAIVVAVVWNYQMQRLFVFK